VKAWKEMMLHPEQLQVPSAMVANADAEKIHLRTGIWAGMGSERYATIEIEK
jgi:hypothetical protein